MQNFRQYSVWKDPYMQSRVGSRPSMFCIILAICHPPSLDHRIRSTIAVAGVSLLSSPDQWHLHPVVNRGISRGQLNYLPDHQGAMIIGLDQYVLGDDVGSGALLVVERIALAVRIKELPRVPPSLV
jgi:hypothetical protein